MCGITGILNRRGKINIDNLLKSMDSLSHRGPDGNGKYVNPEECIGLGHTRLSIIDLSTEGSQPMAKFDYLHITFNGEIYNYVELRKDLEKKNYTFNTQTDTEVLLSMYHCYGKGCLNKLDGMFAFVIWDDQKKKLFAARDRFGEKPFYYHFNGERLVFGSEIKALLPYGVGKTWRKEAIEDFLNFGAVLESVNPTLTFFKDIFSLNTACFFELDFEKWEIHQENYWNLNHVKVNRDISLQEAKETLLELFETGLKRRLRSDVPIGTSLSGGIDSSVIALEMLKVEGFTGDINTFSARFKGFEFDEGEYMQEVVGSSQRFKPNWIWLDENLMQDNLNDLIFAQEEPFVSASKLAQFMVMKEARKKGIKVLIDGQGADEYFGGYFPYFIPYLRQLEYYNERSFKSEVTSYLNLSPLHKFSIQEPNLRMKLGKLKANLLNKSLVPKDQFRQVLINDTLHGSLQGLLRYADRNSMANGVECRLPFLYHELVEFIFSLPDSFKINNGVTKYILRKSFEDILPKKIYERKDKIGYETPNNIWLEKKAKEIKEKEVYLKNNFNLTNEPLDLWRSFITSTYLGEMDK